MGFDFLRNRKVYSSEGGKSRISLEEEKEIE